MVNSSTNGVYVALTTVTPCSCPIKVTIVICEKSVVQFDSTRNRRFSPDAPVSCCSNAGPMRGAPYWTSLENSLAS